MAAMSGYCKAYYVRELRAFPGWNTRHELTDGDHLYLHDSLMVTKGIFSDEEIVFDAVTDEWKQFARETLNFNPPVYQPVTTPDLSTHAQS